jgi:transcriptional antiterminator NusG
VGQKWFVIHVYSGHEKKVSEHILDQAQRMGLSSSISDVLVPSENVVDVRRGKKVVSEQRFYPGYVLVKMDMTDEAWHLIKNSPKVTGFLGGKTNPTPITDGEAGRILAQTMELKDRRRTVETFQIGESVRVSEGPFASFNGVIEELDEERGRLRVTVSIFGRSTPVELEYSQVEKF